MLFLWGQSSGWLASLSTSEIHPTSHWPVGRHEKSLGPRLQTNTHCHYEDRLSPIPFTGSQVAPGLPSSLAEGFWLVAPSGNLTFGSVVGNLPPYKSFLLSLIPPWVLFGRLGHAYLNSVLSLLMSTHQNTTMQTAPNPPFPSI